MEVFVRHDAGPGQGRQRMTRIAIFGAALLGLSAMTGCTPCFYCYPLGNNHHYSDEIRASGWTRSYDGRISKLLAQRRYQEALRRFKNLEGWYRDLDYYDAGAEPLYKRALTIMETALGPEHPYVAQALENYAVLLRETGRSSGGLRDAEAAEMEARAKAIRAKTE